MANKRITDVDFLDSLNGDESFFVNRNNSLKQVNKTNLVFDITNGGTGATTVAGARNALGLGNTNGALPVANGGTGSTSAANARTNLDVYSKSEVYTKSEVNTALTDLNAQTKHLNATVTLSKSAWSSNALTMAVNGVTADNTIIVTPAPASFLEWRNSGVYCSVQSNGALTFACESVPKVDLTANIVILN